MHSSLGVFGTVYVAVVIVINYYLLPANAATHIVTRPTTWTDVFAAVPTICFGFQVLLCTPLLGCATPFPFVVAAFSSAAVELDVTGNDIWK